MPKVVYFSLPSANAVQTLTPAIEQVALQDCEVVYYNTADFRPKGDFHFRFKAYPDSFRGYRSERIDGSISYFQFGELLIDSAISLVDFLLAEIETERPDVIIHSHLAVWGRLLARHCQLPSVTLYSTFVLDKRVMLPYFRKTNAGAGSNFGNVSDGIGFYRKSHSLYGRLGLEDKPDPWDVYINQGDLNISFIHEAFQPQRQMLGPHYHFVGYPDRVGRKRSKKKLIYVAMGTIMNDDASFYRLCIDVLPAFNLEVVIATGTKVTMQPVEALPPHVRLEPFVDQVAVLEEALVFLSRGGMSSVQEALNALTPAIVIPLIPEQQITAQRVEELGIGLHLPPGELTPQRLHAAVAHLLDHHAGYTRNLERLREALPGVPPQCAGARLIRDFVTRVSTRATPLSH
jgi:MGT family glycosyltransferase